VSDPAWPDVQNWIRAAELPVTVLPANMDRRDVIFREVGVSLASALGAVIYETGGLLVDDGWLRILGAGNERLPRTARPDRNWVVIADDAVGGFFALLPPDGEVGYLAPDTLEWERLGVKYSAWFRWVLTKESSKFYRDYRAEDWRTMLAKLRPDQCFQILPPPWSKGPPYPERSWLAAPVLEIYLMTLDVQAQLREDQT
jgi:hypothetical protein